MTDESIVKLLTTAQAAKLLGVQLRRVQTLIQQKRLKASKLGRDYLIDTKDLACLQMRKPGRPRGSGLKQAAGGSTQERTSQSDRETPPISGQRRYA